MKEGKVIKIETLTKIHKSKNDSHILFILHQFQQKMPKVFSLIFKVIYSHMVYFNTEKFQSIVNFCCLISVS